MMMSAEEEREREVALRRSYPMSLKLVPKPPSAAKGGVPKESSGDIAASDSSASEGIKRIHGDISTLQSRINEMHEAEQAAANPQTAELLPGMSSVSSPFVSGLRGMTVTLSSAEDSGKNAGVGTSGSDVKIALIEKFLVKVDEYNKLVVKKTATDLSKSRKMSRGVATELSLIPSALTLGDRALDLHSQLRAAVRQSNDLSAKLSAAEANKSKSAAIAPPVSIAAVASEPARASTHGDPLISPRSSSAGLVALNATVNRLSKQLQEEESRRAQQLSENIVMHKDLVELRKDRDVLDANCRQKDELVASLSASLRVSTADLSSTHIRFNGALATIESKAAFLMKLTTHLLSLNTACDGIGRVPIFEPTLSSGLEAVCGSSCYTSSGGLCSHSCSVGRVAEIFSGFDDTIDRLAAAIQINQDTNRNLITGLHSDLQYSLLNVEMGSSDISAATAEIAALKLSNQSLQSQVSDLQSKRLSDRDSIKEKETLAYALDARLLHANNRVEQLQAEVAALARRSLESSQLQSENAKLLVAGKLAEEKELKAEFRIKDLSEEVLSLQSINEKLKEKMKELVGKGAAGTGKDFLDSFEEAMLDELMMMKTAFEAKLKRAKEEADSMSRKHQEIIRTMQSSKSTTSLAL